MQTKTHNEVSEYEVQIITANTLYSTYYKSDIHLVNYLLLIVRPQSEVAINFHCIRKLLYKEVEECGQGYEWGGGNGIQTQKL